MMKRVTLDDLFLTPGFEYPKVPFFLDIRMYDIGDTIIAALRNMPENVVIVSLSRSLGTQTKERAMQVCREMKVKIVWKGGRVG